jgi:hypothetical protein
LPPEIGTFQSAVRFLQDRARLDGIFTDHPDQVINSLQYSG